MDVYASGKTVDVISDEASVEVEVYSVELSSVVNNAVVVLGGRESVVVSS